MCYAHQQLSPENDLSMKIDSERYVGVTSIKLNFGEITCFVLPAHHCIAECNTTSYPANIEIILVTSVVLYSLTRATLIS